MLSLIVLFLYALCFVLFGALVIFIAWHSQSSDTQSAKTRRTFFLLILSLLVWQVTYLSEAYASLPAMHSGVLLVGRANFAAIAFTVYLAWRFVAAIAGITPSKFWARLCQLETGLLAALTLFTPFIDASEQIDAATGQPISRYGLLFPLYLIHVLAYLAITLALAAQAHRTATDPKQRKQLTLISFGIRVTGGIALITNALLPYAFGEFRYCDVGTLATLFFVLAVAYAIFVHGLFDLRFVIRKTLVYGILLAFVLGGYSSVVFLVTEYLTKGADRLTEFAVLLIAFSLDPLRRWLEKKVDHLLFRRDEK